MLLTAIAIRCVFARAGRVYDERSIAANVCMRVRRVLGYLYIQTQYLHKFI